MLDVSMARTAAFSLIKAISRCWKEQLESFGCPKASAYVPRASLVRVAAGPSATMTWAHTGGTCSSGSVSHDIPSGCDCQCACGSSEVTEVTVAKALYEGAPVFLWILNVRTRMPTRHRSGWRIQTTLENLEFHQTNKNYIWKTELFCSCVHLVL